MKWFPFVEGRAPDQMQQHIGSHSTTHTGFFSTFALVVLLLLLLLFTAWRLVGRAGTYVHLQFVSRVCFSFSTSGCLIMRIFEEEDNGQGSGSMSGDSPAHNNKSSSSGMEFEFKEIKKFVDKASQYYSDEIINTSETRFETAQVHKSAAGDGAMPEGSDDDPNDLGSGDGATPEGIDDDPDDLGSGDGIHLGNGLGLRLHGPTTNSGRGGAGKSGGGGSKSGGGKGGGGGGGGKDKKDKDKDKQSDKEKKKDKEEDKDENEKEKDSDVIDTVPNGKCPPKSELCVPPEEPEPLDCGTRCLYISIQCCECIII